MSGLRSHEETFFFTLLKGIKICSLIQKHRRGTIISFYSSLRPALKHSLKYSICGQFPPKVDYRPPTGTFAILDCAEKRVFSMIEFRVQKRKLFFEDLIGSGIVLKWPRICYSIDTNSIIYFPLKLSLRVISRILSRQ